MTRSNFLFPRATVALDMVIQANSCRLCSAVAGEASLLGYNRALLSGSNSVVMPALGSLIPGQLLFVSDRHDASLAQLTSERRHLLKTDLDQYLKSLGVVSDHWTIFEHGRAKGGVELGCCIDHCHLHLLPLPIDFLLDHLDRRYLRQFGTLDEAISTVSSESCAYVYLSSSDGRHYIFAPGSVPSQFIRQVLATALNRPDQWNWRTHPGSLSIERTIDLIVKAKVSPRRVFLSTAFEGIDRYDVDKSLGLMKRAVEIMQGYECVSMTGVDDFFKTAEENLPSVQIAEGLVAYELSQLAASDAMIVDLSRSTWQYCGALMEIVYAKNFGLPVIAVTGSSSIADRMFLRSHVSVMVSEYSDIPSALESCFSVS